MISGFLAPFADPARAQAVQAMVASMDPAVTVSIRADLARLQAPTLIVWGTDDEFFGVDWAHWLAETIPAPPSCGWWRGPGCSTRWSARPS